MRAMKISEGNVPERADVVSLFLQGGMRVVRAAYPMSVDVISHSFACGRIVYRVLATTTKDAIRAHSWTRWRHAATLAETEGYMYGLARLGASATNA